MGVSAGTAGGGGSADVGAVFTYRRAATVWTQEAFIKASNVGVDQFGRNVAIASDGSTIVVGAWQEASNATGINGNQADNSSANAGAAYVFIAQ